MEEKCRECGEPFETGLDGVVMCKNRHIKKKKLKYPTYPLADSEESGVFSKQRRL